MIDVRQPHGCWPRCDSNWKIRRRTRAGVNRRNMVTVMLPDEVAEVLDAAAFGAGVIAESGAFYHS
jgi:hypothetical protein